MTVRISDAEIDSIRKRFRARLVAELAPLLGADGDVSAVGVEAARLATRCVADEMFAELRKLPASSRIERTAREFVLFAYLAELATTDEIWNILGEVVAARKAFS